MNIPAYTKREHRPVKIISFVTDERSAIAICVHFDGTINEYRIGELIILDDRYKPFSEVTA